MGVPARLGAASASSTLVARGACTEDKITTLLCLSGLVLTTDAKPLQRRCASRLPKEQSFVPRILEFVVCAVSVNVTSMALLAGPVLWQTRHLCLARSAGSSSLAERPPLKPVSFLRFRLKALGRVEPTRVQPWYIQLELKYSPLGRARAGLRLLRKTTYPRTWPGLICPSERWAERPSKRRTGAVAHCVTLSAHVRTQRTSGRSGSGQAP